jgi:tetratricopeptide (TPR) repeat protein
VLSAVLTLVVIAYAGALDAPLLWDDLPLLEHPSISRLAPLGQYLFAPFWDRSPEGLTDNLFYRPLTTLSLALDTAWHGHNPTGFHLTNLFLHLANVSCVFFLARRLRASVLAAGAGALVWGLLPRLAECVSWVSGRTDELGALGVLTALLVWRRGNLARVSAASGLAFLGMLGKEMALAAPVALAVGELWPRPERRAWLRASIPLAVVLSYFALRRAAVGELTGPAPVSLGFGERFLTVLESVGRYVWMTFDVWHPATQIGVLGHPAARFIVLGAVASLGGGVLAWRYARRVDATWAALISSALAPLLLVIHIVPLPWLAVVGDRLMYLPWAIVAVSVSVAGSRLRLQGWCRSGLTAGVAGLVVSLALATRARVAVFADEVEFWVVAVETTPAANWGPTLCLNELYERAGLYRESLAIAESLKGREPQPMRMDLNLVISRALARLGRYEEAARTRYAAVPEGTPKGLVEEGADALHLFDLDRAAELAERARKLLPQYERATGLAQSVREVSRLARQLRDESPPGLEVEIARARMDTLAGRGPEAEAAWSKLISRPELPENVAQEGFAFVAELGTHAGLERALATYSARRDARADLVIAARARLELGDRLIHEWRRVVRALERLRGAPLVEPNALQCPPVTTDLQDCAAPAGSRSG